ncbi:hypothetical protein GCM10010975_20700 [Comamonas phosphati]|nr:hypothetical protein GCM10010975_20700 [Comamonas phosphati]
MTRTITETACPGAMLSHDGAQAPRCDWFTYRYRGGQGFGHMLDLVEDACTGVFQAVAHRRHRGKGWQRLLIPLLRMTLRLAGRLGSRVPPLPPWPCMQRMGLGRQASARGRGHRGRSRSGTRVSSAAGM